MKRLLLLFLLLPLWYAASAQEWLPIKARIETDPKFNSCPSLCLIDRTNVEIAETGSGAFDIYRAVLIGNAQGALENRVLKYDYDPLTAAARFTSVRVYRADGAALRLPAAFFFAAAAFFAAVAYTAGWFSRWVGAALLALFAAYRAAQILQARRGPAAAPDAAPGEAEGESPLRRDLLGLAVGAVLIAVGADLMVDNGILIAAALGVPESVIALTVVALGTSLPELTTAITSLVRGHGALSLGNVVGANLFDLVLVCGVSAALAPFGLPADAELLGRSASLVLDLPVMFLVMLLLVVPPLRRGRLYRWQGAALLAVYAAYCAVQFLL